MRHNHGLITDQRRGGRLRVLASLWDELAGSHNCAIFEEEFQADLEHLSRFQNEFPEASSTVLITLLERKVINAFRDKFSREGIQALRARLNHSN
ncbi:MAG: hypothetical protein EOP86_20050 [Verrucomicrobiaceae bacterium]|nr:MAG: hypothetical protein EOP86_20050 [Verrucomicrobiaceae bacterium]